jgi:uncharacterized membrane protein HdeD (DUF308 family)
MATTRSNSHDRGSAKDGNGSAAPDDRAERACSLLLLIRRPSTSTTGAPKRPALRLQIRLQKGLAVVTTRLGATDAAAGARIMNDTDLTPQGPGIEGPMNRANPPGAMFQGESGESGETDGAHPDSWPIGFRGLLAILFGAIAIANPPATAVALLLVFAAWAFVDGAFAMAVAVRRGRAGLDWGWIAFEGVVSLAAGAVAVAYPGWTLLAVVLLVGIRAILLGGLIFAGALAWQGIHSRWLQALTGIVSVLFGAMLLWHPLAGGLALIWTIGIYAIVFGAMLVAVALRLHTSHGPRFPSHAQRHAPAA